MFAYPKRFVFYRLREICWASCQNFQCKSALETLNHICNSSGYDMHAEYWLHQVNRIGRIVKMRKRN